MEADEADEDANETDVDTMRTLKSSNVCAVLSEVLTDTFSPDPVL